MQGQGGCGAGSVQGQGLRQGLLGRRAAHGRPLHAIPSPSGLAHSFWCAAQLSPAPAATPLERRYLSNLDELAERYAQADPGSPSARGSPTAVLPAPPADPRQLAAELVARAYRANRGGDLLVLLSELQVGILGGCVLGQGRAGQGGAAAEGVSHGLMTVEV